jgi:uncharacterized membrane protein
MIDLHAAAIRARIGRWREAGLIDEDTARRLTLFEAEARPLFGSTLTLIGALSIALGVVAVVSANWDALPIWLKLSAHIVVNLGLGLWAAYAARTEAQGRLLVDAPLIILSASTLAFIAHVGQAFQLQGDLLSPLATWCALTTPFMLVLGRTAAARWAWTATLAATGLGVADVYGEALIQAHLVGACVAGVIVLAFAAPLAARGERLAPWGTHFQNIALVMLVTLASATQIMWREQFNIHDVAGVWTETINGLTVAVIGLAGASFALTGQPPWRRPISAFVIFTPVYAALPLLVGGAGSVAVEAAAICLYWLGIALLAHAAGRFWLYKLAVIVVTMRLFGVFLEAFGGLLATGGGLILAGALFLGLGYGVRRLLQKTTGAVRDEGASANEGGGP